ncbi:MAG: ribonuclease HI [Betaproteobacteria bacterium]|nr:ribonuclease HI [Betaproteobacteria bacterium]
MPDDDKAGMADGEPPVDVYTDGACKGNPGAGGWGALLRRGSHEKELFGGEAHTTNNRMELLAVIRALDALTRPSVVRVHTDSQYVQQGISTWIHGWKRKNWRTAAGAPVKNVDLWKALDAAASRHRIEWLWVRGHAGHPGNERADALANRGVSAASGD